MTWHIILVTAQAASFGFNWLTLKAWLPSIIIAASIIASGIVIERVILYYLKKHSTRTKWKVETVLITSLKGMIILVAVLFGIYYGLTQAPVKTIAIQLAGKIHRILVILIATFVVARAINGILRAHATKADEAGSSVSLFKSIVNIIVYCIGVLVILESLGISITPILTALGVGGLAVALALQNTLANLFSGIQLTLAHAIQLNDYIKLISGEEGVVIDITWNNTTLRTRDGNSIIIPNSKISTTTVTNYTAANTNLSISVIVRVAYNSDYEKVEKVSLDAAREVAKEYRIKTQPVFQYKEVTDSAITCMIAMDVIEFGQQDNMKHKLIKNLYKHYKTESIEIPYPVRKLYLDQADSLANTPRRIAH